MGASGEEGVSGWTNFIDSKWIFAYGGGLGTGIVDVAPRVS